jgi:hypothetical protein
MEFKRILPKNILMEMYREFIWFGMVLTSEFNNTENVHLTTFIYVLCTIRLGMLCKNIVGLKVVHFCSR